MAKKIKTTKQKMCHFCLELHFFQLFKRIVQLGCMKVASSSAAVAFNHCWCMIFCTIMVGAIDLHNNDNGVNWIIQMRKMEILFTPKKLILEVEHVKELSKVYLNIQYKWWNIFLDNILGIKMRLNCKLLLLPMQNFNSDNKSKRFRSFNS